MSLDIFDHGGLDIFEDTFSVSVTFSSGLLIPDDELLKLGTDSDQVLLNRSATLTANTALAGVLIGTPDVDAIAANSLIIGNATADGDMVFAINDGGTSKSLLWLDGSAGELHLPQKTYVGGQLRMADHSYMVLDKFLYFNSGESVRIGLEGADANSNNLIVSMSSVHSSMAFVLGQQGIFNVDLGAAGIDFASNTQPILAVVNTAANAFVSLDAGDDADATSKGLYFHPAADEDIEIINLSVTGTPRIHWSEANDVFNLSHGLTVNGQLYAATGSIKLADGLQLILGGTSDIVMAHTLATNANTAKTGILVGTPVTPAMANNSLVVGNITASGDMLFAVNTGGHSQGLIFLDGSAGTLNFPLGATSQGKMAVKKLGYGAEVDLTIASGVVAVTQSYHSIVVEGGVGNGADALTGATGGSEGDILILKCNTTGANDQVTVTDGTGANTFICAGGADFLLDHVDDRIMFVHNGTEWVEMFRSSNS